MKISQRFDDMNDGHIACLSPVAIAANQYALVDFAAAQAAEFLVGDE
jgi:hypothetical protein